MYKYLTTLYDHRLKRFGLITAGLALILDAVTYFMRDFHFTHYDHHILFHYVVILSLVISITSRDKVDDELSRQIRYSVFKNTLTFSMVFIGMGGLMLSVIGYNQIPTLYLLYFAEVMLIQHLVFYHLGHKRSPKWLLSEDKAPERFNRGAKFAVLSLLFLMFILVIISALAILTGEV